MSDASEPEGDVDAEVLLGSFLKCTPTPAPTVPAMRPPIQVGDAMMAAAAAAIAASARDKEEAALVSQQTWEVARGEASQMPGGFVGPSTGAPQ